MAADRLELAVLEDAEQVPLERGREGGDLVDEQRAPAARATLPGRSNMPSTAPARPKLWPNISRSSWASSSPPQTTSVNGRSARGLAAWIARAIVDLPVPCSPMMTTGVRVAAAVRAISTDWRSPGAAPTIGMTADRDVEGRGQAPSSMANDRPWPLPLLWPLPGPLLGPIGGIPPSE